MKTIFLIIFALIFFSSCDDGGKSVLTDNGQAANDDGVAQSDSDILENDVDIPESNDTLQNDGVSDEFDEEANNDVDQNVPEIDNAETDDDSKTIVDNEHPDIDNYVPQCGNNIMDEGEVCETNDKIECSNIEGESYPEGKYTVCNDDCSGWRDTLCGTCGNGVKDSNETCDAGVIIDCSLIPDKNYKAGVTATCNDTCSGWNDEVECALTTCGDSILDDGEICEKETLIDCSMIPGKNYVSGTIATCNNVCTGWNDLIVCSLCGNGVPNSGEECDDGNTSNNDDCKNDCTQNTCGDTYIRTGEEECDDGNSSNNDECLNSCKLNTCGDGYIRTGVETCDDNTKSCSLLGIGTSGYADCNNSCNAWITAGECKRTYSCGSKPEGTEWNSVSSYEQIWNGSSWEPVDSSAVYDVVSTTTACKYKCLNDYYRDGTECISNIRTYNCSLKPKGTVWNTVSNYEQEWNGLEWEPADCVSEYNSEESDISCRYICDDYYGFEWDGENCESDMLVCTGAKYCMNNSYLIYCPNEGESFYGQDIQYAEMDYCIPKSFVITESSFEEIIVDNNTGLQWQRNISSDTFTRSGAEAHCDGLTHAEYDDWRLPNVDEFETIIDYGKYDPTIDTEVFLDIPSSGFWTSVGNDIYSWAVNITDGEISGGLRSYYRHYAICVRGNTLPQNTFNIKEDIVTDEVTNLDWTHDFVSSKTWDEALNYCETLDYGSATDWRLPNINELRTLVNVEDIRPASNFPDINWIDYWSSTSYWGNAEGVWTVDMEYGWSSPQYKTSSFAVLCVRESLCIIGEMQIIDCSTDSIKKQNQICIEVGVWQNDGDCYECETGQTRTITCATFQYAYQNQICDENGYWQDDGECYEPE